MVYAYRDGIQGELALLCLDCAIIFRCELDESSCASLEEAASEGCMSRRQDEDSGDAGTADVTTMLLPPLPSGCGHTGRLDAIFPLRLAA